MSSEPPQWSVLHDMDHQRDSECPFCQKIEAQARAAVDAQVVTLREALKGIREWIEPVLKTDHLYLRVEAIIAKALQDSAPTAAEAVKRIEAQAVERLLGGDTLERAVFAAKTGHPDIDGFRVKWPGNYEYLIGQWRTEIDALRAALLDHNGGVAVSEEDSGG